MTTPIPPFHPGTIEGVSKSIAELYSHTELTRLLGSVPLRGDPGEIHAKWRRLAHAVSNNQANTRNGNALVALIREAMRPERTLDRKTRADTTRHQLNQVLSLAALRVREDGRVATAPQAYTDTEAIARSRRLHSLLVERDAHAEVLAYCRAELLAEDYYQAVFEAIKGFGNRLQQLSGIALDGYRLIDTALGGKEPLLKINNLNTQTERDEQLGVANLAKGVFSAFRNPAAHEPRIHWELSEQDALDVFATLSLVHRRLDHVTR